MCGGAPTAWRQHPPRRADVAHVIAGSFAAIVASLPQGDGGDALASQAREPIRAYKLIREAQAPQPARAIVPANGLRETSRSPMQKPAPRPERRKAAIAFIFAIVLLDVIALGIVIPVLPKLVESMDGETARAERV